MYALIRFLGDRDNHRQVEQVRVICEFNSSNKTEFENKAFYTVFRNDHDVDEGKGDYNARILMLRGKYSVSGLEIRFLFCLKPET